MRSSGSSESPTLVIEIKYEHSQRLRDAALRSSGGTHEMSIW